MKKLTAFEMSGQLRRAAIIINWMMPHIGRMSPPDNGLSELNDFCIFIERHPELKPKAWGKITDGRPIDQRPRHE